jgi:hypothetical protein
MVVELVRLRMVTPKARSADNREMAVELKIYPDSTTDLERLREWMSGHSGVDVRLVAREPVPNAQGSVWDFLSVVCATGGPAAVALRALQIWIESRTTKVRLEYAGRSLELSTTNVGAVLPELREFIQAGQERRDDES